MNLRGNQWIAEWVEGLGRLTLLTKESIASLLTFKVAWRDLLYQTYFVGVKSQSVVLTTGAFTGMVLAARVGRVTPCAPRTPRKPPQSIWFRASVAHTE
jgi:phospholipid/cholesterol/gamma-HCH transport system permease protein